MENNKSKLIGIAGALGGILIGAASQGYFNSQLERQKFESALILKAIETSDSKEAATNLLFLVEAGFINDENGRIAALIKDPKTAPVLPYGIEPVSPDGSNRMRPMRRLNEKFYFSPETVKKVQAFLRSQNFYSEEINGVLDDPTKSAIVRFQKVYGLFEDGLIGEQFLQQMWMVQQNIQR